MPAVPPPFRVVFKVRSATRHEQLTRAEGSVFHVRAYSNNLSLNLCMHIYIYIMYNISICNNKRQLHVACERIFSW